MGKKRDKKKYNGWTNHATWIVNLWCAKDQERYDYWKDAAALCREEAPDSRLVWDDDCSIEEASLAMLTESLRLYFTARSPLEEPSVYSELLLAALDEVNWEEIARHWLKE